MVADREQAALAERLIAEAAAKQGIAAGQLTLHADRGSSMTSKPVALLLADLGITKTHARPHVSNDNPYSEAQFKTLKYRPDFPARFESIEAARAFCQHFFPWYNHEHRHAGLGLLTPAVVHPGQAEAGPHRPGGGPGRGLRPPPGALRAQATSAATAAPRRCGSTSPSTQRSRLSNFPADLSHRG